MFMNIVRDNLLSLTFSFCQMETI
uniref:Uncharacterized protein n=1 Tax=Rhizophora mucronata TaxID=61149 RepID=A0A2P2NBE7_RHIMU